MGIVDMEAAGPHACHLLLEPGLSIASGACPRGELAAGEFTVVVVGFAASSQFRLNVELVLPARQLRPAAQIAMGQARPLRD